MRGLDGGDEDTCRLEGFWMAHHYLNMRLLWLLSAAALIRNTHGYILVVTTTLKIRFLQLKIEEA